jgi:hypothetical protein
MRFGQLGARGIFAALDAAGVLTHHVAGVDDVERAIYAPPGVARARLRGRLVRELSGDPDRYRCNWQGVWDCKEGRRIDLSDPFATTAEWQKGSDETAGLPLPSFLAGVEARVAALRARRARRADPVLLNQAALEHRKRDNLPEAERLLREAIEIEDEQVAADSPKRPHRRNNLAIVLMRAGNIAESRALNAAAWRLKAGRHDVTSGRILFVRLALRFIGGRGDPRPYVGQLKTLLHLEPLVCFGDVARVWDIPDVIAMLRAVLAPADAELLARLAEALNDPAHLVALDTCDAWRVAPLVSLDEPWPED